MPHARPLVIEPLFAAGLTDSILREVVIASQVLREHTTALDPASAPGFFGWVGGVRRFREILLPQGWTKEDPANLPLVVSPDGAHAIAVMSGDRLTGSRDPEHVPQPKCPRGTATAFEVQRAQESLFQLRLIKLPPPRTLWCLLIRAPTEDENEIRAELSAPESMTDAGFVTAYRCRYVIDPVPLDDLPRRRDEDDDDDDGADIDIDVESKE